MVIIEGISKDQYHIFESILSLVEKDIKNKYDKELSSTTPVEFERMVEWGIREASKKLVFLLMLNLFLG